MSRLTELLRQARSIDAQLGKDLESEFAALTRRRTFGLVFENHEPEVVELPSRVVRRGDKVRVLPPRGALADEQETDQRLWTVDRFERTNDARVAHLVEHNADEPNRAAIPVEDLVVVAEFRDRVYPGLVETGRVENAGSDEPYHSVINAENYHALEMLTYSHRNTVDCIYVDPPYNTGDADWKYNNNYVASDDDYRHSKWLSFMERRLKIARELLNPEDSVLIVTIDEKEYLRLGMLLEQIFPEARIQMVSSVINRTSVARGMQFGRADEYLFFVMLGRSHPLSLPLPEHWYVTGQLPYGGKLHWNGYLRTGSDNTRADRPGCFYPIFVYQDDDGDAVIHSIGDPIGLDADPEEVVAPEGTVAVWPMASERTIDGRWQGSPEGARELLRKGALRLGKYRAEATSPSYLARGEWEKVATGEFEVSETRGKNNEVIVENHQRIAVKGIAPTAWNIPSHDATRHGSNLTRTMLSNRKFPYPKSLYAVEDALRFFVKDKPNAVVLDFFAGSGTTAHAVMRLNKQDGGRRRSISVTNNEVSADEQTALRKKGLRPGDPEWERLGICDYITKPRIAAAITGRTPSGVPIKGDYKFTDAFPMADGFATNAVFLTLTYEDPRSVRHNRAFSRIAPMLWLRAGSAGRIIADLGDRGWDVAENYGVCENMDHLIDFCRAVSESETTETVFIVTDSSPSFQLACRSLPEHVRTIRLYESYLHNFEINRRSIS